MLGIFSNVIKYAGRTFQPAMGFRQFHALPTSICSNEVVPSAVSNTWSFNSIRTIIRNHFPRPSEYKRLKRHGFRARLKTKGGRRVLMNRILKGRFYFSH